MWLMKTRNRGEAVMNRTRIRQVERILRRAQAGKKPEAKTLIFQPGEDVDAKISALRAEGFKGLLVCMPDNGRDAVT